MMDKRFDPALLRESLSALSDPEYADFQRKLVPGIDPATVLGVRIPRLRRFARDFSKEGDVAAFMSQLPHATYEENCLHGILASSVRDFGRAVEGLDGFLPYVDNWAVCDIISPAAFRGRPEGLEEHALRWASSDREFTARFGVGVLMRHFLDEGFDPAQAAFVADLRCEGYYANMMRAWYFATAVAVREKDVLPFMEKGRLDEWTRRKAIQKCVESRRVPDALKERLRSLR